MSWEMKKTQRSSLWKKSKVTRRVWHFYWYCWFDDIYFENKKIELCRISKFDKLITVVSCGILPNITPKMTLCHWITTLNLVFLFFVALRRSMRVLCVANHQTRASTRNVSNTILTNVDDVSENKPFNSICIILALLCYTSGVTVPPIGADTHLYSR